MVLENMNTVAQRVEAFAVLSRFVQRKNNVQAFGDDDVKLALRQLSKVLQSSQKNNLNVSNHKETNKKYPGVVCNNINTTEELSTDGNDLDSSANSPMSTDSESCDSDDQSEPDMDYQQELLSRMMYYGNWEDTSLATPKSKTKHVPISGSSPIASSTMIKDCSKSTLRNNRRRKNRSAPLANSTMIEDLIADIQQREEQNHTNNDSIVTWSIDNNSTNTASVKEYYNRYFGVNNTDSSDSETDSTHEPSTDFWWNRDANLSTIFNADDSFDSSYDSEKTSSEFNSCSYFPRTSTCTDLLRDVAQCPTKSKQHNSKKKSKGKQPVSRLVFLLRSIKRNITKKHPSRSNSRR